MKGKCPSCDKIDDYESFRDICKRCGMSVKLIPVAEKREKVK